MFQIEIISSGNNSEHKQYSDKNSVRIMYVSKLQCFLKQKNYGNKSLFLLTLTNFSFALTSNSIIQTCVSLYAN